MKLIPLLVLYKFYVCLLAACALAFWIAVKVRAMIFDAAVLTAEDFPGREQPRLASRPGSASEPHLFL